MAVKDLFDTAGLRTTYGSILFADHVPERTAEAVARLEAAGYVNVGKTNLHEFAYGVTSYNPHFGEVQNPLAPDRTAGGSSAGSAAALAAGLADAALGSDSGGSIRIPAACCGVVGFKPSRGLVPLEGCFPLAPSFDHAGPMGRDVETCVRMLEALAPGFERAELGSLDELEVGVAWVELAEPLVRARIQAAVELFPRRRVVAFPFPEGVGAVFMREAAQSHRGLFPEHADAYGENVRAKLERCLKVTDAEFEAALCRLRGIPEEGHGGDRGSRPARHADAGLRRSARHQGRPRDPRCDDPLHLPLQRARLAGARAALRPGRGRAPRLGPARGAYRRGRLRTRRRLLARAWAGSTASRSCREVNAVS